MNVYTCLTKSATPQALSHICGKDQSPDVSEADLHKAVTVVW